MEPWLFSDTNLFQYDKILDEKFRYGDVGILGRKFRDTAIWAKKWSADKAICVKKINDVLMWGRGSLYNSKIGFEAKEH